MNQTDNSLVFEPKNSILWQIIIATGTGPFLDLMKTGKITGIVMAVKTTIVKVTIKM